MVDTNRLHKESTRQHDHKNHHHNEHVEHSEHSKTHDQSEHHEHEKDGHGHHHNHNHADISASEEDEAAVPENARIWHVEGMDCASCIGKITSALKQMPGVDKVVISLTRERLSLVLDEKKTQIIDIEKTITALGFSLTQQKADIKNENIKKSWYQTNKGRAAIIAFLLLALAYGASVIAPPYASWFFSIAALIALIPIAFRAYISLIKSTPFTIEMLMTIAVIGALIIPAAEEAAVVVFLFCVGEVLESIAAARARSGIKALAALAPKTAMCDQNGKIIEIAAEDLNIGDIIIVRPGDRIAGDGVIVDGTSGIDESPVTGESVPIVKNKGDKAYAGSINSEATLRIKITTKASDNTIARIITLVEEAQDAKAPTERFIDAFAKIYMPIILGIALLVGIIPPLFDGDFGQWTYRALSLLLIGCPCALVISVPAAIASGLSAGTRHGLLVKGGHIIESLAKIDRMSFDKTGTLTKGQPQITDIFTKLAEDKLLSIAFACEQESSHPLAKAINDEARKRHITAEKVGNLKNIAGKGVFAKADGKEIFVGAPRFAAEFGTISDALKNKALQFEREGKTVIVVQSNKQAIGLIALRDEPRQDSKSAIEELKNLGITCYMLTGDNQTTGQAIATSLHMQVKAELMPEMKAKAISELRQGHKIAMVGDGINDAPALAAANVGIAMGSGTDVALETADAALMRNQISDIPTLIRLSRATMGNIWQNITIALGLKLIFLITTILGITGLWLAIMADTGATVLVTLNALRLLAFKGKKT